MTYDILTDTIKYFNKFFKIKSLYRGELHIKCICGRDDIITLKDVLKYKKVRCNKCYSLNNDIKIENDKVRNISDLLSKEFINI